jgi:glucokinase
LAVIGIDLGATKTAGLLLNGDRVEEHYRALTDDRSPQDVIASLIEACSHLRDKAASRDVEVEAIGLGIAGFVDFERGVVTEAPNHPLHDTPVRDILEKEFGLPAYVDNDANVAALAEALMGAGRGSRYIVHLTLGTGIGGGIVIDGSVYRGALGSAAELGHMIILEDGPLCNCGARGCLEALASGVALNRRVEELAVAQLSAPVVEEFLKDPYAFEAEALSRHAAGGDRLAAKILADAGRHLGVGIASLVNIFNPDVVTLSGGLLGCYAFMEEPMRLAFEELAIPISRRHVRILTSTLGEDGGMLGAALLASSSRE